MYIYTYYKFYIYTVYMYMYGIYSTFLKPFSDTEYVTLPSSSKVKVNICHDFIQT